MTEQTEEKIPTGLEPKFGIVVMLDALGVRNYSIDEAENFIKKRDVIIDRLKSRGREIYSQLNDGRPYPDIATFGDSIIFMWSTKAEHVPLLLPFVSLWLEPVILFGIEEGILLRGAVSVGNYIQYEATILGPAIADVVSWYEEADWFGLVATPKCELYLIPIIEKAIKDNIPHEQWFVNYNVPLKTGTKKMWVLSWPESYINEVKDACIPIANLSQSLWNFQIPKGTESKYENSLNFFKHFESTHIEKIFKKRKEGSNSRDYFHVESQ